jgi:hypothetical protein
MHAYEVLLDAFFPIGNEGCAGFREDLADSLKNYLADFFIIWQIF